MRTTQTPNVLVSSTTQTLHNRFLQSCWKDVTLTQTLSHTEPPEHVRASRTRQEHVRNTSGLQCRSEAAALPVSRSLCVLCCARPPTLTQHALCPGLPLSRVSLTSPVALQCCSSLTVIHTNTNPPREQQKNRQRAESSSTRSTRPPEEQRVVRLLQLLSLKLHTGTS